MSVALVTGGAGFIGSHLAESLVAAGRRVRILDNFSTGRRANPPPGAELVEGDLRDPDARARALRDAEVVFHLAALASVPRSIERPEETHAVNVEATLALFLEAGRTGARRIVFASSSSVYGDTPTLPKREDMEPRPLSPYAVSKLAGEHYARMAAAHGGVETVSLRFFNVYGPRQDPSSPYAAVIPIFLRTLREGGELPVYGDGLQTRDFTFVGDVVRGLRMAERAAGISGRVFNLAGGHPVTLLRLADELARAGGREPRVRNLPPRPGDILHSHADVRAASDAFGFRTEVPLADGLAATWAWFRSVPGGR